MKCERCGEGDATVAYTEYREGKTERLRICEGCAQKLGFRVESEGEPAGESEPAVAETPDPGAEKHPKKDMILGVGVVSVEAALSPRSEADREVDQRKCTDCGMSGSDLRRETLLGCPGCYETFGDLLDDVLRRAHGAVEHRGRLPGGRTAVPLDAAALRERLRDAIENEDFEEAARVRDRLRRAKRAGCAEPPTAAGEEE